MISGAATSIRKQNAEIVLRNSIAAAALWRMPGTSTVRSMIPMRSDARCSESVLSARL